MKCIILAGGRGDRMWPLSRKNYPKQFIQIKNNHSIFQETIARNMAFCDEFIIVTNQDFQSVIENQMKAFRGLTYRCIFEETGHGTAPAVVLSSLQLPQSEMIFVVASDQLISGENYKNSILEAKALASDGHIVAFGMDINTPDTRYDYIRYSGNNIEEFISDPDRLEAMSFKSAGNYYINAGMFLYRNGDFLNELSLYSDELNRLCDEAYSLKQTKGNYVYYSSEVMKDIPHVSMENILINISEKNKVVHCEFDWQDVGGLDDLENVSIQDAMIRGINGKVDPVINNKCLNTTVINRCKKKLVMVNHLRDVLVVNTDDAVYIGKKGQSNDLKEIILDSKELWDYFNKSSLFYRKWGNYEVLTQDEASGYEVRRVTIIPGKTIYLHKHVKKNENISILSGKCKAIVGDSILNLQAGEVLQIPALTEHQLSCVSDENLVFIETSTGVEASNNDVVSVESEDMAEGTLGFAYDSFVLLKPAYKDYLWGGNRLKDLFNKENDLGIIAESWELSAHPDGQSTVASGKYEGLLFADYLEHIGIDALGWKYQGLNHFPLIMKLIDASDELSIQVHPNDDYALEHENEYGKSEYWYIIDCEPDSCLYIGFNRDVTKEEVDEATKAGRIEELLNKIEVKKGDRFFIPAGTVHAIGKGCLICEIQQNSNSTYRLYDFNRIDKYGKKRQLDIAKALDVIDYKKYEPGQECKYFSVKVKKCLDNGQLNITEESFVAILILEGSGSIEFKDEKLEFTKGDCVFVPASNSRMKLFGNFEYVEVRI